MMEKNTKKVGSSLQKNMEYMQLILPIGESFDVLERKLTIGGKGAALYFVDGFTKDEVLLKIMDSLLGEEKESLPPKAENFVRAYLPYAETELLTAFDEIMKNVLSGVTCLLVDGYQACIAIDCRTYPARSVSEPDKDKSLRGSRDGFVETVVYNTALLRRRIRRPQLIMEMLEVGRSSRTDVVLSYMRDRVDTVLLDQIRREITELKIDDLRMNQQSLAKALFQRPWINPLPKYKVSERPDTTAACLLEGKIVVLVDNSPSAMILPTSIFDMIEEANDYYFPTVTALYLKCSRLLISLATVFLTPLFLLFMQNPQWLPKALSFVKVADRVHIPLVLQFLILELSIDGLRLAALNTPNMLSTPLSVIAGIVMGEFAVRSGWFNSEVMLYMSFVAVADYTQPNYELGYGLKFIRLLLLLLTALFGVFGFLAGVILFVCMFVGNRTLSGRNYLHVKLPAGGRR